MALPLFSFVGIQNVASDFEGTHKNTDFTAVERKAERQWKKP